ncbi:restriction endonuclease (plasmid) [Priestia aryabhattai]|uniref:restriction endonuclease n=1 Tax=Priestia aryabhattai TaxID=412384 RepID=UPI001CCE181C|nr:restriction endonuclease [Priestia aryabhattai]MBZ6485164.1 restriction endonuclease [Priestia aryabhattai]MDH3130134.1 restriction endonuclease [Priestia aryabhattai]
MFKFIKKASNNVLRKKKELEDLDIKVNEINKTLEVLEMKKEKIISDVRKKEQVVLVLQKQEAQELYNKKNLEKEISNLTQKHQELLHINQNMKNEIQEKALKIEDLNKEVELLKAPLIKKKQKVLEFYIVLKQIQELKKEDKLKYKQNDNRKTQTNLSSYNRTIQDIEKQINIISEEQNILEVNSIREIDPVLDELMERFNHAKDLSVLISREADSILEFIKEKNKVRETSLFYSPGFIVTNKAIDFYNTDILRFFSLLNREGYSVKGKEKFYLSLLREKAIEKNYNKLEDEFFLLFELNTINSTVNDVINMYIQILQGDTLYYSNYLHFLNVFLFKNGFIRNSLEIVRLEKLIENQFKVYEINKLKKELFNIAKTDEDKTITLADINLMSGERFEHFLVDLLQNLGFRAKVTKLSGDQGVDIIAKRKGKIYAIQAKRYAKTVGNKAVQEVVAGKEFYKADVSWVITNSDFSPHAIDLADKTKTILWNGNKLNNMIECTNL